MYSYSMVQWLFFFYLYCFAGWCIESAYVSIRTRKLTNRGFMRGPFLPIYGSGAIMMLVVSMPFQDNIVMTYVAGCIGATVLEYVTGVTMELLFKMRYWDYSDKPLNFQGHICLGSTLSWGFLTILMTEIVHVPVERLVLSMPPKILAVAAYILTAGIFADFALSFKAAIDLRDVLVKMEQIKEEMMHIHGRLGAIVSRASQGMENYKTAFSESVSAAKGFGEGMAVRMEDLKSGIESKVELLKSAARTKPTAYLESVREEVLELVAGRVPLIVELKADRADMAVCREADRLLSRYEGLYCIESFNPLAVLWYRLHRSEVVRGQLSDAFWKEGEYVGTISFLLQNLLFNWLGKPDFIAYNCKYPKMLSKWLCRRLYHIKTAAWTIKSREQLREARKHFDIFIFDGFVPKGEGG